MALHLSVPAFDEKPLIGAEKRPKVLQGLLEALPADHPVRAAQGLVEHLSLLNRQEVGVDTRLKLLEIYRPWALKIARALATHYQNQTLPLSDAALVAAASARGLLTELAYGYKVAILDDSSRVFSLGSGKSRALLIQRALHSLGLILQVGYYTYVSPPETLWSEIHQLYLYSAQQGIHETGLDDAGETASINLTYKRLLLLSLADPHHLASAEVDRVQEYLARYAELAQLHPMGTPENPAGVFLIRLKSDQGPLPLTKHRGGTDLRTDILLITVELARQVSNDLNTLKKVPAAVPGLPTTVEQDANLLNYLIRRWALAPKRTFSRLSKNESTNLCAGLEAVHYFLSDKADFIATLNAAQESDVSLNFTDSPLDSTARQRFSSTRWLVVNESAGGLALSKFPGVISELIVGDLLGIRSDRSKEWGLGVVRWASSGDSGDLEVGAQMMAPSAKPVAICQEGEKTFSKALLLPEIPTLQQPVTLVTACGVYHPARKLEVLMEQDGKPVLVLLTRLLERTGGFERFQFSQLN